MADAVAVAAATPMNDVPLPVSTHAPPTSPESKREEDEGYGRPDLPVFSYDETSPDPALLLRLARTAKRFGGRLARASTPKYLRRKLATSEGTDEVYANLQREVASLGFLARLRSGLAASSSGCDEDETSEDVFEGTGPGIEEEIVLDEETDLRALCEEASLVDDDADYVFVETEDVISAVAEFVAAYLMAHPAASRAPPESLQRALGVALTELRGADKSKVRRVWAYGVGVYRGASWTYATLTSFTNPWIARIIVCAVYTGARLSLGAVGLAAAAAVG